MSVWMLLTLVILHASSQRSLRFLCDRLFVDGNVRARRRRFPLSLPLFPLGIKRISHQRVFAVFVRGPVLSKLFPSNILLLDVFLGRVRIEFPRLSTDVRV